MKRKDGWKKTKAILIVSFIFIMSLSPFFILNTLKATTYYVESTDPLQDIINDSSNGDIIQINESITLSDFVNINKSIILQGKTGESVQINGSNYGLNITKSNVIIRNLTLFNCSTAFTIKNDTFALENITFENIIIQNCSNHGLYLHNVTFINISKSTIANCTVSGIKINNGSNLSICNNAINNTATALYLTNNANKNTIFNNTFKNNSISINITSSENNTIVNNTFLNKTGLYHAYDNSLNTKWNTTHGNYWDDYTGTNADDDIYGDISYTSINGGSATDKKPLGFFVPIINFTYEPLSPTTANTIVFTDESTDPNGGNLNYSWDFDDCNYSYEQSPTHNYSDNGSYNVTLNVTNEYGQWNITNQTIIVSNVAPTLSFNISPTPGIVNETMNFKINANDNDGTINNWTWTLGDGTKKYTQNTTHQYIQSGAYTITLNATDDDEDYTNISTIISVTNRPSVNFTYSPPSPSTSDTITFTDASTDDGSISSWSWDFDDGNTSSEESPTHIYNDDGTYYVILNVTDNYGATNQTNQTITVSNSPPIANFTYTPHNATDLQTITFTNCSHDSDGTITNCTWSFGDGEINYSMNTTTHQYNDNGTYTVNLNVTDDDGDTDEYNVIITISNVGPTADFTYEPANPEIGETIWFNDTSSDQDGAIDSWSWDFGDDSSNSSQNTTHTYATLKNYHITLTVTDNDGNSTSTTKQLMLKKTTTKPITSNSSHSFNLKTEANTDLLIKTSHGTNLSVTTYSDKPTNVEETISNYENLETYVNITLEDKTLLEWINLSIYYTENDLNDNINESSLQLFYWNETCTDWIRIPDCIINNIDIDEYSGFVQSNLTHLTLFTLGGKTVEEEETIPPKLPTIVNTSNNTVFTISTPTLNVTYSSVVPKLSATLNGTTLLYETTDNKTFSILIHTDLTNGNYTLQLHLTNSTLKRTDTIHFKINLSASSHKANTPIEIPLWLCYLSFFFIIIIFYWYIKKKTYLIKNILNKKKSVSIRDLQKKSNSQSQGFLKDTMVSLHHSMDSVDSLLFGSYDPWVETKEQLYQTLYNIDIFTKKPDAYVGIQQQLIHEQEKSKIIIDLLNEQPKSLNIIREKTQLTKEELGHELSILLKYGLITQNKEGCFQLSNQGKKLLKK